MKKLLSAALAAALALALTACSSTPAETPARTSDELATILTTAINENSEGGADVITASALTAATDWLTENKGMSAEDAAALVEEYGNVSYEERETFLAGKGLTADEINAFQEAEATARNAQMIFETLGLSSEDFEAGALSISLINVRAYGMAIIKPAEGKEETVTAALQNFIAGQQQSFENYLQDQYAIAQAAKCETVNGYVVMAMGENSDAIFQAISDALNANA